jgi:biopolymer transport protein ExbD
MSDAPGVQPPLAGPATVHQLGRDVTTEDIPKRHHPHKSSIRVAALNITAFMDLTFNLLLFFVLTASFFLPEVVLPADLPSGGSAGTGSSLSPAPPKNPVSINLRSIGMGQTLIQIEGSPTAPSNFEDLYEKLRSWRHDPTTNPNGIYKDDNPIIIKPDRNVAWKDVVNAFNTVIRAKYKNVGFAPASG